MIDTIVLLVPLTQVQFDKYDSDSEWNLQSRTRQYEKFIRNPTKKDEGSGLYFPRLTLYRRAAKQIPSIRIEFSAPKLIYNNNLQELQNTDFEIVVTTLNDRLERMNVFITRENIVNAKVSAIHYAKNIKLDNGYTSTYVISQIAKINVRKTFDFTKARYMNDGQSLVAHTSCHELIFYDKIADLMKPKKRATDRDQTPTQKELFDSITSTKKKVEILRLEVRLSKRSKMKNILKEVNYREDPIFKDLFNEEMSKQVILHYWNQIVKDGNLGLFLIDMNMKDLMHLIYRSFETMKPKQVVYLMGLLTIAKEHNGLRELRSFIESFHDTRTWYRMYKDFRVVSGVIGRGKVRDWIDQIDNALDEFKPITKIK